MLQISRQTGLLPAVGEGQKALVHHQADARSPAFFQDGLHQLPADDPARGVVGGAEKGQVQPRLQVVQNRLREVKVPLRVQDVTDHPAARGGDRLLILGKGGGSDQCPAGPFGKSQPKDQVGRPIAAEDLLRGHAVPPGDGGGKGPA